MTSSPEIAVTDEKKPEARLYKLPKTTGEKYFSVLRFAVAEVVILAFTAVIAFVARHGPEKYGPVPNYIKKMQDALDKLVEPMKAEGKSDTSKLFASAFASTMVTFHGGNLFAPGMKWFQDKRTKIVNYFNARFGDPGEVEIGKVRLKREGKETWGDIVKGRLASWAVVFSSFFAADAIAGVDKKGTGMRHFDKYTERFGRWAAGFAKSGKEIAATPIEKALTDVQKEHKPYLFGKILALDLFATTAAIIIWNAASKISAMLRKETREEETVHVATRHTAASSEASAIQPEKKASFTTRAGERPANFRALASKEPASSEMAVS